MKLLRALLIELDGSGKYLGRCPGNEIGICVNMLFMSSVLLIDHGSMEHSITTKMLASVGMTRWIALWPLVGGVLALAGIILAARRKCGGRATLYAEQFCRMTGAVFAAGIFAMVLYALWVSFPQAFLFFGCFSWALAAAMRAAWFGGKRA